jgi:hypothetical protein
MGAMVALAGEWRLGDRYGSARSEDPSRTWPQAHALDGYDRRQTVKGGQAGPTFHEAGGRAGRTIRAKRTVLIEIMGLPVGAHVESAKPHDVSAGRRLIHSALPALATVTDVLADRGYRGLTKAAGMHHARVQIKAPAPGQSGFKPIAPLYKVRARLCPARSLATAVALFRANADERRGMASCRRVRLSARAWA